MANTPPTPFERVILRAVLNDVSPIVARVLSIPDDVEITELHGVFLRMLGWQHDLGFINPSPWAGLIVTTGAPGASGYAISSCDGKRNCSIFVRPSVSGNGRFAD